MSHIKLGRYNQLTVVKTVDFGVYLDGDDDGEILLPQRYVPEGCQPGDILNVFIYLDNEERLVATTLEPLVQVGEFAYLEVAWTNQYGAFLNWGLMKDLFVPFREQKMRMQQGKKYLVHAHLDEESYRIMASAKVERFLSRERPPYAPGDEVEVLVWQKTDLGVKTIVDNQFGGLIYDSEIFVPLAAGMRLTAYVKQVREDGKIDLTLQRTGYGKVADFSAQLHDYLQEHGGILHLHDKSPAEAIYATFGVSKKTFKKGVGDLYKQRLITISEAGIKLVMCLCIVMFGLTACGGHDHEAHKGHDHAVEHNHEQHHEAEDEHGHSHTESEEHGQGSAGEILLTPEQAKASGVLTEVLKPQPFRQVIPVSGELVSAQGEEAVVVANVAGTVHFNKPLTNGLHVGRGAQLLTISSGNMAEGSPVERARIAYEAARHEYERAAKLVEEKIVSEKDFIRIKEAYENARLTYEALSADKSDKRGSAVKATIDGYIKSCLVSEGDYVSVGQPLLEIACTCRIYLRADVPERHYAALSRIRSANFRTTYHKQVYTLDELNGRMLSYGHTAGGDSYYLPVTFELDNREGLVPGSYAEIWLLADEKPEALVLPLTALTEEQGIHYAYVQLDESCYERREVNVGADNGHEVEILSGLKAGERLVTQGAYQIRLASASKAIPGHSHEH